MMSSGILLLLFLKAVRSHSPLLCFLVRFDNQIKLGLQVLGGKQLFKNVSTPPAANLQGKFSVWWYTGHVMPQEYLYMEIVHLSAASEQQ